MVHHGYQLKATSLYNRLGLSVMWEDELEILDRILEYLESLEEDGLLVKKYTVEMCTNCSSKDTYIRLSKEQYDKILDGTYNKAFTFIDDKDLQYDEFDEFPEEIGDYPFVCEYCDDHFEVYDKSCVDISFVPTSEFKKTIEENKDKERKRLLHERLAENLQGEMGIWRILDRGSYIQVSVEKDCHALHEFLSSKDFGEGVHIRVVEEKETQAFPLDNCGPAQVEYKDTETGAVLFKDEDASLVS